ARATGRFCGRRDSVVGRLSRRGLDRASPGRRRAPAQGPSAERSGPLLCPRHHGVGELVAGRRSRDLTMIGIGRLGRLALIGLPFLWLMLFFLVPLLIVLKISLARSAIGIPPYTPLITVDDSGFKFHATLANFALLANDDLYLRAYLGALGNAALATVLCLLLGYPIAYAIARARWSRRQPLLFLVMLPFW